MELLPEVAFPAPENDKKKFLSDQARIVLSALVEPKRRRDSCIDAVVGWPLGFMDAVSRMIEDEADALLQRSHYHSGRENRRETASTNPSCI